MPEIRVNSIVKIISETQAHGFAVGQYVVVTSKLPNSKIFCVAGFINGQVAYRFVRTDLSERVIKFVRDPSCESATATINEILTEVGFPLSSAEICLLTGLNDKTVRNKLGRMLSNGEVVKVDKQASYICTNSSSPIRVSQYANIFTNKRGRSVENRLKDLKIKNLLSGIDLLD